MRTPARLGLRLVAAASFAAALPLCAQEPEKSVVAVARFDNDTGHARYDNLGRAMSSMMISDLSVERIRLVERERMEEVMAEQNLQYSGRVDEETAVTLGLIVGAQYVVFGSFMTIDPGAAAPRALRAPAAAPARAAPTGAYRARIRDRTHPSS